MLANIWQSNDVGFMQMTDDVKLAESIVVQAQQIRDNLAALTENDKIPHEAEDYASNISRACNVIRVTLDRYYRANELKLLPPGEKEQLGKQFDIIARDAPILAYDSAGLDYMNNIVANLDALTSAIKIFRQDSRTQSRKL